MNEPKSIEAIVSILEKKIFMILLEELPNPSCPRKRDHNNWKIEQVKNTLASRLMNTNARGEVIQNKQQVRNQVNENVVANDSLKKVIRETMEEVLRENGLMTESTKKSNEQFKFRVGQHMFEGRVTKIRKISE